MLLATMRSFMRGMMRTMSDQTSGIPVKGATRETGVSSPTDLPILTPRRVTSSCWYLLQVWSSWPFQKDYKKNTTASTSGQADKKPGASGRVFAISEGHAANTLDNDGIVISQSHKRRNGIIDADYC
nr:hypothetical protein [Tanacetum cinerariifolium]